MSAAVERAPDLADDVLTRMERDGCTDEEFFALVAEVKALRSSLRAVDAKVVEWRERAQRAEDVLRDAEQVLCWVWEDECGGGELRTSTSSRAFQVIEAIHAASVPASQRNDEGGAP